MRLAGTATLVVALLPGQATAQSLSRVSLDSVGAIDMFRGEGTTGQPGASIDVSSVVRLNGGWSVQVRPWFFKSSALGATWSHELYQAAVRYERAGRVSTRLDAGFIASPIGLGMLDMRADFNPTIQSHVSYFMPLQSFDPGTPGVGAIKASYPLGANLTLSSSRWDVRGAVVSSAPTRRYALFSNSRNPDATPVGIAGGGLTLRPGLRIGASFAAGRYATDAELRAGAAGARRLQMWTTEAEFAFGYTKLSAEVTQTRFARIGTTARAASWFVQGVQTLSPRWFSSARHEVISTPPSASAVPVTARLSARTSEASVGYRVTPELTVRGSVTAVRGYTAGATDRRAGIQLVWSRRWW